MRLKLTLILGFIPAIIAFISVFLPWYLVKQSYGSVHMSLLQILGHPSTSLFRQWWAPWAIFAFITIGGHIGFIGGLTNIFTMGKKAKRFLSPIMLLAGGILTLFSPIVFDAMLFSPTVFFKGSPSLAITVDISPHAGYWLALVAGILMLIASILKFISLKYHIG